MNKAIHILTAVTFVLASVMPSHAATDGPPEDLIGIVFWIFVAYCAIIIVPHGIRAVIAAFRSPVKGEETPVEATESVTDQDLR
ncbi:MAG: hypothetical protein CXR31_10945 [Geobacter sp.]|nr:MAG: hypothetical protein CXR31_10945 [Geobacter sp.]